MLRTNLSHSQVLPVSATLKFGASSYVVSEGSDIQFTIIRGGELSQSINVTWAISGATTSPQVGQVTFDPGDTQKIITVNGGPVTAQEVGTLQFISINSSPSQPTVGVTDPVTASFTVNTTSALSHGELFSLVGSGFGTKAFNGEPMWYDDFEGGTIGAFINGSAPHYAHVSTGQTLWQDYSSLAGYEPEFANIDSFPNSTRHSRHRVRYNAGYPTWNANSSLEIRHSLPNAGDEMYLTFYYRYKRDLAFGPYWAGNLKPWILYGSIGDNPIIYQGWGQNPGDTSYRFGIHVASPPSYYGGLSHGSNMDDIWLRMEVYVKAGNTNTFNGSRYSRTHSPTAVGGPLINEDLGPDENNCNNRTVAGFWDQLHLGAAYWDPNNRLVPVNYSQGDIFLKDVFLDNTRKRVEIGNATTYNACTQREVQPAEVWSDGNVSARLRQGFLPSGVELYAYVIGSDGNPISQGGNEYTRTLEIV